MKNVMREIEPGHIGLISENHPGITDDKPLGWGSLERVSETPFTSSSLCLFKGESVEWSVFSGAAIFAMSR